MGKTKFFSAIVALMCCCTLAPSSETEAPTELAEKLCHAADAGDVFLVSELLDRGADPNLPAINGSLPLIRAASAGRTWTAVVLLSHGASPRAAANIAGFRNKISPLWAACDEGDFLLSYLLILFGADVNQSGPVGQTPLFPAVIHDHAAIARMLIIYGAKINIHQGHGGRTPIMWSTSMKTAKMLLAAGADINAQSDMGETALEISAGATGDRKVFFFLIKSHADPNIATNNRYIFPGTTPLMAAVDAGCLDEVKALVEAGADVKARNGAGHTVLDLAKESLAAGEDVKDIVDYLQSIRAPK